MKCREAQYWLYSFQPNAAWPADVVGHLQQCSECRRVQNQLRQIDQGVQKLTTLPANDAPVAHLLQRIAKTSQVPVEKAMPRLSWSWARVGAYLTGVAALIAFGWGLGRYVEPIETVNYVEVIREKPVEVIRERVVEKVVPASMSSERSLFANLLKRNAELVQGTTPGEHLESLLDMADDCRQHAVAMMADGPRESLPMTVDLYAQLLRDGVLVQLAQAPTASQPALKTTARTRLQSMAETDAPKSPLKVLADQFDMLQRATRQTLARLDRLDGIIIPKAAKGSAPSAPATALVQFAIAYSSESDPVVKADCCADYVRRITPAVMLCLADEALPQRAEMGERFGELIQFGIYHPLATATAAEPPAPVKAEAERIVQNARQTVADMEKHLEQAPEGTKAGFKHAIDASQTKPGKNKGKGPRDVHGVFKRIDPARNTITISARVKGKDAELTYALTTGVASSNTLKSGMDVHLRLSDDRRVVIGISHGKGRNSQGSMPNR